LGTLPLRMFKLSNSRLDLLLSTSKTLILDTRAMKRRPITLISYLSKIEQEQLQLQQEKKQRLRSKLPKQQELLKLLQPRLLKKLSLPKPSWIKKFKPKLRREPQKLWNWPSRRRSLRPKPKRQRLRQMSPLKAQLMCLQKKPVLSKPLVRLILKLQSKKRHLRHKRELSKRLD